MIVTQPVWPTKRFQLPISICWHLFFRILASTHFEPTSARMAFPCFDEPSFKANFSIRIRRSPEYISLSNMPVVSVEYVLVFMHFQMCGKKMAIMNCLYILGQDSWSTRRPSWGPVWCKCKDEHVPRSFCHLWLQICHCDNILWGAGVVSVAISEFCFHAN